MITPEQISGPTRWWWVRHAPVIVAPGLVYGQQDLPCRTDDRAAFASLAATLPKDAVWVASNLQRTQLTAAAICAAGLAAPAPQVEPGLAEQNFGAWEGQSYTDLAKLRAAEYHRFWHAPATECPPGGESFADLCARVWAVVDRLNQDHAGRDIVAVAHGGTIRAAVAQAFGVPLEAALAISCETLSLTRLDHFGSVGGAGHDWRIVCLNRIST